MNLLYMFYMYNFISQKLIWKMISVSLLLMVLLMKSQGMKNFKSAESFCLIILTIYTNDWSTQILTHLLLPYLFFSARFQNICKARTTFYLLWWAGPPRLGFYGSGPARLQSWLEMVNVGRLGSMWSNIFLKMKFTVAPSKSRLPHQTGCLFTWTGRSI